MPNIHPTAIVDSKAEVADDVEIGPYSCVGPDVTLAAGCRLGAHVNLTGRTSVGARTRIAPFASLGTPPQSVHYRGEPTRLVIGSDCDIREGVTMNVGTAGGGGVTEVGDRGFFMAYCHIAHDCKVGSDAIFANSAMLGGHCVLGDYVFMGGIAAAHQFTRIGAHAMIGGAAGLRGDVIPFGIAAGPKGRLEGVNVVGMKRRNFSRQTIYAVRAAYRMLFDSKLGSFAQRIDQVDAQFGSDEAVAQIVTFVRRPWKRPISQPVGAEEE